MDNEKMRAIIYHPLKQQGLPKYVKHHFGKFALSNFDLLYPFQMFEYRDYVNHLLDEVHKNYHLKDQTDDDMYVRAIRFGTIIYNKMYRDICAY